MDETLKPKIVNGRTYFYPSKKYYKNFCLKNRDKIKEKIICPVCGGSFTYYNKSHHFKTKKHISAGLKFIQ